MSTDMRNVYLSFKSILMYGRGLIIDELPRGRSRLTSLLKCFFQLESGAQEWATKESEAFELSHSCEECTAFGEVLAKRRSTKPLPEGGDAGDWVYRTLFSEDPEGTYTAITDDARIHTVGFGIAFSRHPVDKTYHLYAVLRFARGG